LEPRMTEEKSPMPRGIVARLVNAPDKPFEKSLKDAILP